MFGLPEIPIEITVIQKDKPLGFIGRFTNRILKWLHDHWDDTIVYFPVDKE